MSSKPTILCQLKSGQALAAADHLRETWNWMVNWCANLKGKGRIRILDADTDHPTIELEDDDSDGGSAIEFESAADSNVVFTKSGDKIVVGVYYK